MEDKIEVRSFECPFCNCMFVATSEIFREKRIDKKIKFYECECPYCGMTIVKLNGGF